MIMEERQRAFLNAISDNLAYEYIASHYCEFTKEELKDIILEFVYPMTLGSNERMRLGVKNELEERWDTYDEEDDYSLNMPCDNSGFCAGMDCKQYFKCFDGKR